MEKCLMKLKKVVGILFAAGAGIGAYKIFGGGKIEKYSKKWFNTVSYDTLEKEREIVRKQFCSAGNDFERANLLQKLLNIFDSVMSKRDWNGQVPQPPSYHREHGYNLYKPD